MKQIFQKLILLFGGTLLGLLLMEAFSSFVLPPPRAYHLPFVRMQADPLCGYRFRPNQTGYIASGKAVINSWGFRGKNWNLEKPEKTLRVALLGDSYVLGQGVDDENVFASKLESLLNQNHPAEVLNFGVSGYDAGHELKVLENYVIKFHPDIVVLHFFLNDLLFVKDYSGYEKLFSQNPSAPKNWLLRNFFRHSRLAMFLWDLRPGEKSNPMNEIVQEYVTLKKEPPFGLSSEGWQFELENLKRFRDLSFQYHFKPVLAVIPTPQEITAHTSAPYQNFLKTHAEALGITSVLLFSESSVENRRYKAFSNELIPYDGHFSEEGHIKAARTLAKIITDLETSSKTYANENNAEKL